MDKNKFSLMHYDIAGWIVRKPIYMNYENNSPSLHIAVVRQSKTLPAQPALTTQQHSSQMISTMQIYVGVLSVCSISSSMLICEYLLNVYC